MEQQQLSHIDPHSSPIEPKRKQDVIYFNLNLIILRDKNIAEIESSAKHPGSNPIKKV